MTKLKKTCLWIIGILIVLTIGVFIVLKSPVNVEQVIPLGGTGNAEFQVDTDGTLTTNLLAYWKLEDTADSWSTFTLTNGNTVTFVAGKVNNSASFARTSSQYLQTSSLVTTAVDDFSVSLWVNIPDASEYGCFFHNGDPVVAGGDDGWSFGVGNTTFDNSGSQGNNLLILANGVAWKTAIGAIGTGWHHIIVMRDSGTWKGYIDTVLGTTSIGAPSTPTVATMIGANNTDGASSAYWNDKIDEVAIWDKVLSAQEITDLYNSGSGQTMVEVEAELIHAPVNWW